MMQYLYKTTEKHGRFYILLACLLVLLITRYGFQIDIPRIVLTAIIAIIALLGDRDEILAITMCCIPLHGAVDFHYALMACSLFFVLKYPDGFRINLVVCIVLLSIMWELLHCFTSDFLITNFLVSFSPLIFLMVILCMDVSEVDYGFVVRITAFVVAATCITLLCNLIVLADFNIASAIAGLQRLGVVDESDAMLGSAINPNTLGVICVLAATGLLQLRAAEKNIRSDILLLVVLLVFGAATSSKTFLACLLVMTLMMILGQPGAIKKKIRLILVLASLFCAALFLLKWLFPDLLVYYTKRFQKADITTGRGALFSAYHNYIFNTWKVLLFGIGIHTYGNKLTATYRIARDVPHNAVQEIIIAWGIPGLILLLFVILMFSQRSRKYSKGHTVLNYIPLIIILFKSMAGQLLTSAYSMLALSYAYLSLCQNFQPNKET